MAKINDATLEVKARELALAGRRPSFLVIYEQSRTPKFIQGLAKRLAQRKFLSSGLVRAAAVRAKK